MAQLAAVVGLVTCTDREAPAARSPKLHVSTPEPIEQPATAGLIDHTIPVPVGSVSLTTTLVAVPGPALDTVTVNPMASPASTWSSSACLTRFSAGHCTVVVAEAFGALPLPAVTEA